jgi:hypothetical protein
MCSTSEIRDKTIINITKTVSIVIVKVLDLLSLLIQIDYNLIV